MILKIKYSFLHGDIRSRKTIMFRGFVVSILGLAGLLLAWEYPSICVSLSLFTAFSIATILAANAEQNLLHPLVAFPLFYYPYASWHTYYLLMNGTGDTSVMCQATRFSYCGLLIYQIVGNLTLGWVRNCSKRPMFYNDRGRLVEKILMLLGALVVTSAFLFFGTGGFSSKREIIESQSIFLPIMSFSLWILTATVLLSIARWRFANAKPTKFVYMIIFQILLVYLIVGERDFLFRIAACCLFLFADEKRNINFASLIFILLATTVVMPWAQQFKAYLLEPSGSTISTVSDLFLGDFYAASRNLYIFVDRGYNSSWQFLWNDLLRGMLPFSSRMGILNSVSWFHLFYRYDEGIAGASGWGFHLVTEGLLFGGIAGIIVVMTIVSALISILYRLRNRSEYCYVFYLLALSSAIYCIRADLANLISMIFKIGGTTVLLIKLMECHLYRDSCKRRQTQLTKPSHIYTYDIQK